jgi:hypothetical protein
MAKAKDNPTSPEPLSDCRRRLEPTVREWRDAITAATALPADAPPDGRKPVEADVCLTSRSSYLDYFTWVVIRGSGDEGVEREFDDLFHRSLAVLADPKLKGSVRERYDDFRSLRERVRAGHQTSRPAFSTLGG